MADEVPGSWRGVINRYRACPVEVQDYFKSLPELIEGFDWEVALGFMFIQLEKAMNMMLYCGVRKIHRAEAATARRFVDQHHMTRKEFRRLFKTVFGEAIPPATNDVLAEAEKVRDKVIHGKSTVAADQRRAVVRLLAYAEAMNALVERLAGFKPFVPDLRGFAGRGESLDASTTVWLMKGMGFIGTSAEEAAVP